MKEKEYEKWLLAEVLDMDEGLRRGFVSKREYEKCARWLKKEDEKMKNEDEISQLKLKIIDYLRKHKKAYVSDLAVKLNTEPRKIVQAAKELKDEGAISIGVRK